MAEISKFENINRGKCNLNSISCLPQAPLQSNVSPMTVCRFHSFREQFGSNSSYAQLKTAVRVDETCSVANRIHKADRGIRKRRTIVHVNNRYRKPFNYYARAGTVWFYSRDNSDTNVRAFPFDGYKTNGLVLMYIYIYKYFLKYFI